MITSAILILIVAKALPGLNTHISSIHVTRITSIVYLFAGALSLNTLNLESIGSGIGLYSGLFQVTAISQLIEIFLFMIGGGILIAWPQIKQNFENLTLLLTDKHSTDYSLVVLFSSLGSSLLISSYDLISVYLSIELQSFGLYVLSTLYRDSESSTNAGLKYFLLGGLSSCIILLGTGIIYSYTGTTNLESLYIINSIIDTAQMQQYIIQGISLGLSLIFIGFLFKIAAAPLHNWSPDVYDGTPTIVTTWLTIIPKIAILIILLELQVKLGVIGGIKTIIINSEASGYLLNLSQSFPPHTTSSFSFLRKLGAESFGFGENLDKSLIFNNNIIKTLLLISATLSLIIGSLLGLAQIRIKRLLAYSTISHIGFILLALAVNTEQSIDSFIFYIIQYTITNLNIFLVILGLTYIINTSSRKKDCLLAGETENKISINSNILSVPSLSNCQGRGGANKDISFISEFKGLFFNNPLLCLSLAVSLFSMAGIPPLIGFFSKQLVLYSALQNGYYFISVIAIIVSVISCSYYLQIIKLLFTPATATALQKEKEQDLTLAGELEITDCKTKTKKEADIYSLVKNEIILTNTHSYLISTLTFSILLFFIKPSLILNSTQLLSLSLFYI